MIILKQEVLKLLFTLKKRMKKIHLLKYKSIDTKFK